MGASAGNKDCWRITKEDKTVQTYIAIKYTKKNPSALIANRLQVKAFKGANELGAFLCKQDNTWADASDKQGLPAKSGHYAYAGGAWHNVKSLDASVLAHI